MAACYLGDDKRPGGGAAVPAADAPTPDVADAAALDADTLHEECGVFGVWAPGRDVARMVYFGLRALQHRGQESAGIAVGNGETVVVRKDNGLAGQVFTEADLNAMPGKVAVGHVRYGTSGGGGWEGAQPHLSTINEVIIALAHNGTLVNTNDMRRELIDLGVPFRTSTDSEVAAKLIGYFTQQTHHLRGGIASTMAMIEGAYAMVLIRENALYAFRDPNGIRPLVLGELPNQGGWVVASETCALDIVDATYVRDIEPGEIVRISDDGLVSRQEYRANELHECIFEQVYFARPDSVVGGGSVYMARRRMGEQLAREAPVKADVVIGVPDSGLPPAEGFSRASGIPYSEGLIKNRYVFRTFIQPTQELREMGVRMKLNALKDVVDGQRVVLVDDSIVRGTTMAQIVKLLRDAGAREVHVRINCPEVLYPCFYGIDTGKQAELISAKKSPEAVCGIIGADSVAFLSLEGLLKSVNKLPGYCCACFDGCYAVPIPPELQRQSFLEGYEPRNLAKPSPLSQMSIPEIVDVLEQVQEAETEVERSWSEQSAMVRRS